MTMNPTAARSLFGALLIAAVFVTANASSHQDAAVEPPPPVKTSSGLVYEELVAGTGRSPTINDVVRSHYHGTLADGSLFDS